MASPLFRTAIGECDHNGILQLADISKDAWILILNYIHPVGRADSYAEKILSERLPTLIDVLRQCQKYAFGSLYQDLDRRIASRLYGYAHRVLSTHNPIFVINQPESYLLVDVNLELFQPVRMFDLPRSENAMASYLISVLKANNLRIGRKHKNHVTIDRRQISAAISPISQLMAQMRACGRYRMCSLLLLKMMDAQICVSVDITNF